MRLKELLNSKISLLLIGFVLTGVVGSFLNHQFQKEAWKRQAQHEIAKRQLNQAQNAIEATLLFARKRFYSMQKVFWSLESSKDEEAQQRWVEYYKVKDWPEGMPSEAKLRELGLDFAVKDLNSMPEHECNLILIHPYIPPWPYYTFLQVLETA